MADINDFATVLETLELALSNLGLTLSPFALDTPIPTPKRNNGYALDFRDLVNTKKYKDRSRMGIDHRLVVQLQHSLRPGAKDQRSDLLRAATNVKKVVDALMGSQELNALGHVNFSKAPTKRERTGEWLLTEVTMSLRAEWTFELDGGNE